MTVGELTESNRRHALRGEGLRFRIGPFAISLRSSLSQIAQAITCLYAGYPVEDGPGAHFTVSVNAPSLARRLTRPQAQFYFEGHAPFLPLPQSMAGLFLEGGLNWCIGNHAHQFVVIHSATLERKGLGLLMPAPPGSGKSTLCAALVGRGWRLLSDEFALIDPATGLLRPVPRPIALKNGSIDLIRRWIPDAVFGPDAVNSEGQTVAHMRAPAPSIAAAALPARPALVVVPRFVAGAETTLTPLTRARTALHLADSSFNYNFHGRAGFERLAEIASTSRGTLLRYSRLDEGVAAVDRLLESA